MGCSNTNTKEQLKNESKEELKGVNKKENNVEEKREKESNSKKGKKGRCKPKTVTKSIKKTEDIPPGAVDFFDGVLVDNSTCIFPLLVDGEESLDDFAENIATQIPTYVSKVEGVKPDVIWVDNVDDRINGYNYNIDWSKEKMLITKGCKLSEIQNEKDKIIITYSNDYAKENYYYCYIVETSNKVIEESGQPMGNNFIEQRVMNNGPRFIEQRVVNNKVPIYQEAI